jgi:glycosyltransferase involved in cell wall biosynthesis
MPEVSIVIPAFNRANLIAETLESVMGQGFTNWECLIIDDRSSDDTPHIAKLYCEKDPRFRYFINCRLKGAQGARNMGLDLSAGEFVIFLDSDDLLASFCLQNRVDFARENPGQDFYCFETALFNKQPGDMPLLWNYLNKEVEDIVRFLRQDMPWHTSGVMWKKEVLLRLSGWDEKSRKLAGLGYSFASLDCRKLSL